MSRIPSPVLALLVLVSTQAGLAAQAMSGGTVRGDTRLNASFTDVSFFGHDSWRITSPQEGLPPAAPGDVHTGRLVYTLFGDVDPATSQRQVVLRRSLDGGHSWQPPQVLVRFDPRTRFEQGSFEIAASGHHVYVVFASNQHALGQPWQSVQLLGSGDQGRTWSGPVLVSRRSLATTKPIEDVNTPTLAAVGPIVHVAWTANELGHFLRDPYYGQARFARGKLGVVLADVRLNTGQKPNVTRNENPSIAARNVDVLVAWQDGRGGKVSIRGKYSQAAGADLATLPEIAHFTAPASRVRPPHCLLAGDNVYVGWEDDRNKGGDELYLRFRKRAGAWDEALVSNANATGADIDSPRFAASGDRIVATWQDDRNGSSNTLNNVFVMVDETAGAGFKAGSVKEVQLSKEISQMYTVSLSGDTIAVVHEQCAFPEDFVVSLSIDGGKSWLEQRLVTTRGLCSKGNVDVDDPFGTVTANGDVVFVWQDNRNNPARGNDENHIFATGLRMPELDLLTKQAKGVRVVNGDPAHRGFPAVLLLSGSGTTPPLEFDPYNGIVVNLAVDPFTTAALGVPQVFVGLTDANGVVAFPRVPDLPRLTARRFWLAGVGLDANTGRVSFVTDPVEM